ncbi:MAG: hypothetical protein Kow00121_65620 [Elainellaceae cyanobacterium]
MPFRLEFLVEQVRLWFPAAQSTIKAQAADLEAKLTSLDLNPLAAEEAARLQQGIDLLLSPQVHRDHIRSHLTEAIDHWCSHDQTANHLVVLGSPVESPATAIQELLNDWHSSELPVQFLSWSTRPYGCSTLREKLQGEIGACSLHPIPDLAQTITDLPFDRHSLVVIPDLSWCFLRCVEGLEGIEYLFDLILEDRSRFWLIGCNHWTWRYFNYVFQVRQRFDQTIALSPLNDVELKQWLVPLFKMAEFQFGNGKSEATEAKPLAHQPITPQEVWASNAEERYFDHLADISLGLSQVAAQLWLHSLGYVEESEPEELPTEENKPITLKQATLPDLPTLSKDDRYLLFSLGLHGGMRLADLALSLGDAESLVRTQVQALWRSGVILRQQDLWQLNPYHYPRLRRELNNNQVLVGDEY